MNPQPTLSSDPPHSTLSERPLQSISLKRLANVRSRVRRSGAFDPRRTQVIDARPDAEVVRGYYSAKMNRRMAQNLKGPWLVRLRLKRRKQTLRAVLGLTAFLALFSALVLLGYFGWKSIFGEPPPTLAAVAIEGLGSLLLVIFADRLPLLPAPGKPAEELAAEEFLKGPRR
jgi:hypothetical protein